MVLKMMMIRCWYGEMSVVVGCMVVAAGLLENEILRKYDKASSAASSVLASSRIVRYAHLRGSVGNILSRPCGSSTRTLCFCDELKT